MEFSAEISDLICDNILSGERPFTAAANAGVTPDQYMDWTHKHPAFKYAVMRAVASAQARLERRAFDDALKDGKQAREELRVRDPHQHSEKMAIARAEHAARDMSLPDAVAAREKAEAERRARLDEWKQHAHLIEAGSKVIPITHAHTIDAEPLESSGKGKV